MDSKDYGKLESGELVVAPAALMVSVTDSEGNIRMVCRSETMLTESDYFAQGWKRVIDNPPTPSAEGKMVVPTGWTETENSLTRQYEEQDMPPDPSKIDVDDLTEADNLETMKERFNEVLTFLRNMAFAAFTLALPCVMVGCGRGEAEAVPVAAVGIAPLGSVSSTEAGDDGFFAPLNKISGTTLILTNAEEFVKRSVESKSELSQEEVKRGITFIKEGIDQNGAIAIGTNAIASIDPEYVKTAPSNTVLRSVSIAIGGNSDARNDGKDKSQSIAIGWFAQAKAINSIAIGSGAQHTNETAMTGNATVATSDCAIAIGYSAKAVARNAMQIGAGTNSTPNSLQFFGTPIVRNGRIVIDSVQTNDVIKLAQKIVDDMLSPRTVSEDETSEVLSVQSYTTTTYMPTNSAIDELTVEATSTRNFEIYFPNVFEMRESLPLNFGTESDDLVKLGEWWSKKVMRLPALMRIREPMKDTVLLEVSTYDDGYDWSPVVTNATLKLLGGALHTDRVFGYNLHSVTNVSVSYETSDGKTNVVKASAIGIPLYGTIWPTVADISEDDIYGTNVMISVTGETGDFSFSVSLESIASAETSEASVISDDEAASDADEANAVVDVNTDNAESNAVVDTDEGVADESDTATDGGESGVESEIDTTDTTDDIVPSANNAETAENGEADVADNAADGMETDAEPSSETDESANGEASDVNVADETVNSASDGVTEGSDGVDSVVEWR